MKKEIELLAPVGSKEAFIGAINAGADAVYLAGIQFGARKFANNFTNEELIDLLIYAHVRNVRVFVTINTVIYASEINEVLAYADLLVRHHVDALIVQDIGLIETFVKRYPNTDIHASTQLNTYSIGQLKYLKSIGVSRVILARETSLEEIKEMIKAVDIELEIFVHGALCVSASGNCYFSYMNGGRSGNRGECAQPCRLTYELYRDGELRNSESYLLSTKDVMTLPKLDALIDSGVVSFKIEGRMRRKEYVVSTVKAYREAIDAYNAGKSIDLEKRIEELSVMYNRKFTSGYLFEDNPKEINYHLRPNHQGIEIGEVIEYHKGKATVKLTGSMNLGDGYRIIGQVDVGGKIDRILFKGERVRHADAGMIVMIDLMKPVESGSKLHKTTDYRLDEELSHYFEETYKLVPLTIKLAAYVGKKLKVSLKTPYADEVVKISDYVVEEAKNKGQTKEQIVQQFVKFGQTFYDVVKIEVLTDEAGFIPNKVLKDLRRDTLSLLEEKMYLKDEKIIHNEQLSVSKPYGFDRGLFVKVEHDKQCNVVRGFGVQGLYCTERVQSFEDKKDVLFLNRIEKNQRQSQCMVVHDMGQVSEQKVVISSPYMNVTNHLSVFTLLSKGVRRVTLSPELNVGQVIHLVEQFQRTYGFYPNVEVLVYGKLDLMISAYCPIQKGEDKASQNCYLCERYQYSLRNAQKKHFSIVRDSGCHVRILDAKAVDLLRDVPRLKQAGIGNFAVYFSNESTKEVEEIMKRVRSRI